MIGSPDVVAFAKDVEYGQTSSDHWEIPEEFSVPLHPQADSNPWAKTSYAKFTKDFILISEFSEQVGPQPLLTIPEDPKVCGTFDLNYFSLRIMSVDYQASFVGHPPGSGYPRLSFVEDSRVVLGDSKEGAFAYVHHLTLYDLEARGFVRPFCMAYISADERKIMLQFQELSLRFSQASECLKTGNRRAFAKEIQRKLQDLEYTHSVLQKEEGLQRGAEPKRMYSPHAVEKANELANVEKSIFEHRDLLRQISSYPCRPRRDPHAAPCQRCLSQCLREGEQLLEKYRLSQPSEKEAEDQPVEEDESAARRSSYTPQLIKAKSAKCFDKRLKTLQELCDQTFYQATVDLLKETEKSFRGELCYLQTRHLDRALRTKQGVTNFLFEDTCEEEDEDGVEALRPFCAVNHAEDSFILLNPPPIVLTPEPAGALEPTSEPSLGVEDGQLESSQESFSSELRIQTDPERESSSEELQTTGWGDNGDHTPVSLLELEVSREDAFQADAELLVPADTACCMAQDGFLYEDAAPLSSWHLGLQPPVVNQEPQALLPLQGDYTVGSPSSLEPPAGDSISRISVEDGSDCTMSVSTESDRAVSPLGYGGAMTLRQKRKAGQAALRFVRQYPFAAQALWCLMSGRPLVVLGEDEGRVRRLVAALALFVPAAGRCAERVQAWLTGAITLTDLQRWRLIGLQRTASPAGSSLLHSLSRYSRYISILDLDHKTLRCPSYQGQLMSNLADHRTAIRRGSTYFLHLQGSLCGLAAKAFLYSFTHHLHLPVGCCEGTEAVEGRRRCFLQEQLGLSPDDARILIYLSQLITQQYLTSATGGNAVPPTFTFDYTSSVLYKI
ncbi:guanine nucleotide exchange protein smcr8a [Synchiropus picturatus]